MKIFTKKLFSKLLVFAIFITPFTSFAYTPSNADLTIADILFERILEVSEIQNNQEVFAQGIKMLITNLQNHPKSDERTKTIFGLIITEIDQYFGFGEENTSAFAVIQEEMLSAVNAERSKLGKSKLQLNQLLNTAAQKHAQYMSDTKDFAHTTKAGLRFDQRISNEGYLYNFAGENIAYGQPTIDVVMKTRMNSPGHKANIIEDNFTELGVGYAGIYRVQVFARPQD